MEIHRRILAGHVVNLILLRRCRECPFCLRIGSRSRERRRNHTQGLTRIRPITVNVLHRNCGRTADWCRDRVQGLEIDAAVRIRVHCDQVKADACIVDPLCVIGSLVTTVGERGLTARRIYRQHIDRVGAGLIECPLADFIAVARYHRRHTGCTAAAAHTEIRRQAAVSDKAECADVLLKAVVDL